MCECGCVGNDDKYTLPGPDGSFYVLSLSVPCENCDAPPGISIQKSQHGQPLDEFTRALEFQDWPDGPGVAIVTGMRKCEFIKAMASYLIGIRVNKVEDGRIDKFYAEVVIEEMYPDSQIQPRVVCQKLYTEGK